MEKRTKFEVAPSLNARLGLIKPRPVAANPDKLDAQPTLIEPGQTNSTTPESKQYRIKRTSSLLALEKSMIPAFSLRQQRADSTARKNLDFLRVQQQSTFLPLIPVSNAESRPKQVTVEERPAYRQIESTGKKRPANLTIKRKIMTIDPVAIERLHASPPQIEQSLPPAAPDVTAECNKKRFLVYGHFSSHKKRTLSTVQGCPVAKREGLAYLGQLAKQMQTGALANPIVAPTHRRHATKSLFEVVNRAPERPASDSTAAGCNKTLNFHKNWRKKVASFMEQSSTGQELTQVASLPSKPVKHGCGMAQPTANVFEKMGRNGLAASPGDSATTADNCEISESAYFAQLFGKIDQKRNEEVPAFNFTFSNSAK